MIRDHGHWLADSFSEHFAGRIGDTFTLRDSYEQDGVPVTVDVRATVLGVKDPAPPPPYNTAGAGKRWVRVNFKLHSRSTSHFTQSTDDIQLIDTQGRRYHADGSAYEPSLGNGGADLSQGDTVVGFEGYAVPRHAKLKAVRLSTAGGTGAPLIWRVG